MGFELAALWSPWIIFGVASIVVVGVIIVLTIVEKVLDKKIRRQKEEEERFFREKIEYLKSKESKPELFLVSFNEIVLEVFREALGLSRDIRYEEAVLLFKKRGNVRAARFANRVQMILYSGEKVDKAKLDALLKELIALINEFRAVDEEKKVIGEAVGFENYVDVFMQKIEALKNEFGKFEKVKESVEKEIGVLRGGIKGEIDAIKKSASGMISGEGQKIVNKEGTPDMVKGSGRTGGFVDARAEGSGVLVENKFEPRTFRVMPVKKEKIKHRKVRVPKKESEDGKRVGSLDDLGRIRERVKNKKGIFGI